MINTVVGLDTTALAKLISTPTLIRAERSKPVNHIDFGSVIKQALAPDYNRIIGF
jgi:hypothetical protein